MLEHVSHRYIVSHFIISFLDTRRKDDDDDDHGGGGGGGGGGDDDDDDSGEERSQYKHMHNEDPRKSESQMELTPTPCEKLLHE